MRGIFLIVLAAVVATKHFHSFAMGVLTMSAMLFLNQVANKVSERFVRLLSQILAELRRINR